MSEPLPEFRYHPDPVATGAFERSAGVCRCCGRGRGWRYLVTPYAEADLRDALCPWCIADGSAAERFDAVFTDLGEPPAVPSGVAADVVEELTRRTPGFAAWEQERWLFCCGDGCAFLGAAGWDQVADLPDAIADLRTQAEANGWTGEDADAFVGSLDVDGASTAYLFRCRHCHRHHAYADLG